MLIWSYRPGLEGGSERQCREIVRRLAGKGVECDVVTSMPAWFGVQRLESEGDVRIFRLGWLAPLGILKKRILDSIFAGFRKLLCGASAGRLDTFEKWQSILSFWLLLPSVWLSRLSFLIELAMFDSRKKPHWDIIHLHEPSWLCGVAVWLSRRRTNCCVLSQEATSPVLQALGYDVPFRRKFSALRKDATFIAMAPYLETDLRNNGVAQTRIFRIPNGVNIPEKAVNAERETAALYVGNFSQGASWKAFDVLIKAWAKVHACRPSARLTLLGGGDHSAWLSMAGQLGCAESLTFAGRVSEPGQYYSRSGIFILPSRVEGMSNALLEAQSYGLACIASDIPGNAAVIDSESNGLLVPVGDDQALANSIVSLLDDASLRKRVGEAARAKALQAFSFENVIESLLRVYNTIIPSPSTSKR